MGRVTSLEGKLPRSVLALAFLPGKLGAEWLAGRRARWSSPFSLFLVVNLLYFLSPPVTDFHLPLKDQMTGQGYSTWALERVEDRVPGIKAWLGARESGAVEELPAGFRTFEKDYNDRSKDLSRSLLILHVPFLAVALLVMHRRRRVYFVDHFVNALHYWTFLLLSLMVFPRLSSLVNAGLFRLGWIDSVKAGEGSWKLTLVAIHILYLTVLLRRAYGQGWPLSLSKAIPAFVVCALTHFLYRALLFAITCLVI